MIELQEDNSCESVSPVLDSVGLIDKRLTYELNHSDSFPGPCVCRKISSRSSSTVFKASVQTSFTVYCASSNNLYQIPFSVLCEAFGKSTGSISLS